MTVEELQILITMKTEKVRAQIDGVKKKIAEIQPKKSADVDVSTSKAQGNLKKLQSELERTQAKISKLNEKMNGVFAQQDAVAGKYRGLPNITGMTRDQSMDYMVGNDPKFQQLGSQLDRLDAETAPLKAHLEEVKSKIAAAGNVAEPAAARTRRFGESMKSAGSHIQGAGKNSGYFGRMVKSMLLSMALFSGVSLLFRGLSEGMQNMALGSAQANNTMSQLSTSSLYLKNSVAAALMPALQALTPVIMQVSDAIAYAFNMFGALTARIFNHSSTITVAQRANVNYAATLGKVKQAADEAKRSVMGFDEINTLSKPSEATSTGAAGMPAYADMFKMVKVPDWVEKVGEITDKVRAMVETNLGSIKRLLRMAPLVIGAVLAFSGINVPLGIGLMAIGAIEMTKQAKEDWGYLSSQTNTSLDKVKRGLAIAGAVELALGAILAFSGAAVPLGIGLMIGGIATTAATLNWDSLSPQIKNSIAQISFATGEAMLVLGAILAFSGANIPLGIGLIVGGATTLASAITLNWDSMDSQTKITLAKIAATVGAALLVVGAILALSGVNLPLGIGLMAVGAINLGAAAALNLDTVKDMAKTVLSSVLAVASASSIAIGLMLCLTGAGLPLGIGLILAGMAGTHAAASISKTPITDWAKGVANGVVEVFESAVNYIISMLNKLSFTVPDWAGELGGKTFGVNISPVHIPRLATGGLITGPTYSLIGEGKDHEAVLPLNSDVYSRIGEGIAENRSSMGNEAFFGQLLSEVSDLRKAILDRPVNLYTSDQKIAESANRGNVSIDRRYHPVATT